MYIEAANYAIAASFALLVYDTLLTLFHEIAVLWRRKLGMATLLYSLARYPCILLFSVLLPLNNLDKNIQNCSNITTFLDVLNLMSLCGVEGLLLARTYAISKNDRAVLIVLGCLMLGSIIPQIVPISDYLYN